MHPLRQQPILESLILVAGMISIMLLIQGTSTWIALSTTKQNPPIAKKEASGLRLVQAASCLYGPPDNLGSTQDPYSSRKAAEDDNFNKPSWIFEELGVKVEGAEFNVKQHSPDRALPKLNSIIDRANLKMEVYKASVRSMKDQVGNTSFTEKFGQVAKITTIPGESIRVPESGWRILNGTRLFGLVMAIEGNGIRLANSRNDKPTNKEGYNIYISGINVDKRLIQRYNTANDKYNRACLPEVSIEDVLGTAQGNSILVAIRDNGDLLPINSNEFWSGSATVMEIKDGKASPAPNQTQPAAPAAQNQPAPVANQPAPPVAPATTTTPGPVVLLPTIQASVIISNSINNVKKIVSGGATQARTRILLLGDSNTANENFGRVEMTWKSNQSNKIEYKKIAKGEWNTDNLMNQLRLEKDIDNNSVNYTDFKYALILIGLKDSDNFSVELFKTNLKAIVDKLLEYKVIPILQTINDFRTETGRKETAEAINAAIITVADDRKIPYVDTSDYIKAGHMTRDGFHFNTKKYGPNYCSGTNPNDSCDPPSPDTTVDDLKNLSTGHGIRNVILREAIRKIEEQLETVNKSIIVSAVPSSQGSSAQFKPLTLFGVQAQTAPESIISILQSYGSSGYLCYDFGGLSCVPATLSTIEGRAVRVDVTVDKSYPAKPICVSRTNSCNGGIFLDPNL